MRLALIALSLVLALPCAARAEGPDATTSTNAGTHAAPAPHEKLPAIAVMEFSAPEQDRDRAKGLSGVVAARLATYPGATVVGLDEIGAALGLEKQKQLVGCDADSCLAEISGALGVRYVVHGRIDRFGDTFLLNAFAFDSKAAKSVTRWSEKVEKEPKLVDAAQRFADQVAAALGLGLAPKASALAANGGSPVAGHAPDTDGAGNATSASAATSTPFTPDFHLNLKFGNTLGSLKGASLSTFNLRFDLEGDYYFTARWQAFLQVGVVIGSATDDSTGTNEKSFQLVPAFAGAKYTFRAEQTVRPYIALGLGLGILNSLFKRDGSGAVGLTGEAVFGLLWAPFERVGFNAEVSVNLSGVSANDSGVFFGFNTNFGVVFLF
ncbi:MAG: hypothetical protein JST92_17195 [Deltaproteobacteria bacterium]|nr:hypothetical protein [Deltaproteobacteria bacterium]